MPSLNDLLPSRQAEPSPAPPPASKPVIEGDGGSKAQWVTCDKCGSDFLRTYHPALSIWTGTTPQWLGDCDNCARTQALRDRAYKAIAEPLVDREIDAKTRAKLATIDLDIAEAVQAQLNLELQRYAEEIRDSVTSDIRRAYYREERSKIEAGYIETLLPSYEAEDKANAQRAVEARHAKAQSDLEAERARVAELERLSRPGACLRTMP
jgi:hypothetical protein